MIRLAVCVSAVVAAACATTPVAAHEWWHGSITVANDSNYDINHLFLTPSHEVHWGPDQLGQEVLASHHEMTLVGLECEAYDLKLIDHEGDECVVHDIDLCLQDAHWHLTDHELSTCTGFHK
jgi:hypothetical protein